MKFVIALAAVSLGVVSSRPVSIGPRPYWLVDQMREGALKSELESCAEEMTEFKMTDFSIGHRGACMQFPEHTLEGYKAAAVQGAGIVECDVTFTKDRQLICRHSQCDLHTTTNVVAIPELNAKCSTPWAPMQGEAPNCCASDFTLAEIKMLCAKMDSSGTVNATTPEDYLYGGTEDWRTDLYSAEVCPEVPTHMESIKLIGEFGSKFTPELKSASMEMPYEGDYTQEMYAQQMIDEYITAGIPVSDVWPQSFNWDDVIYWIGNTEFGDQAVALDDNYEATNEEVDENLDYMVTNGIKIVAPPMQMLVEASNEAAHLMVASHYAMAAKERELSVITWSLERAGPGLAGFYYGSTDGLVDLTEGDRFTLLHVLHTEVGILGMFSDWPATVTFYANCMGISLRSGTASESDKMELEMDGRIEDSGDEIENAVSRNEGERA